MNYRKEKLVSKNLVIFYSRAGLNYVSGEVRYIDRGNTEVAVDFILNVIDADVFRIETVKEYSTDYYECTEEAKIEKKAALRPELRNYLADISGYDNIFVCGPCWWSTYPMAVFSQLEKLDSLDLSTYGKITGLDKLDSVTSLILHHPNEEVEKDICGMDSLRELKVYGTKFSDEVDRELEEKHVSVKYIE